MRDFSIDTSSLSLNTATLGHNIPGYGAGWSTERVIDACAERKFGGITFWRPELEGKPLAAIGDRVRDAGMTVTGLCRSPFLVGPLAPSNKTEMLDDFKAAIDETSELGALCLTVLTGGVESETKGLNESIALVTELLNDAVNYASENGVSLALEPLHPVYGGNRSCIVTIRDAVEICNIIDNDFLGVAVDVYHVWWDMTVGEQLKKLSKDRILSFHLCDWLADTQDVLLDRGMMGDGVVDIRALRSRIERAGFDGFCEVEVFSAQNWWKKDPADVLDICVERYKTVC